MVINRVKETIKRYNLLNKKDKIVIGVSGGADSVTLLYVLNYLKDEFRLDLHVAHLDHKLRKDSYRDAEFVKSLAEKLKIPVTIKKVNIKKLCQKGSLEEAARTARLDFFFKLTKEIKADKIALGHNLNDQAETVLMRILRGTGLYGLAGILPKRNILGYCVIRPLIETSRKDIEMFLRKKNFIYRQDASNSEDIYFRNKIRNKLIPMLEKGYNSNIKEVLSNTAQSIAYDYDYLNCAAMRLFQANRHSIDLEKLLKLHPALRRLMLRLMIARLNGDMRRITFVHIRELEDLILNRPQNSIVNLPKNLSVAKKKHQLYFSKN